MVLLQGMLCYGAAQPKSNPHVHAKSAGYESREQTAHFAPGQKELGQKEVVVTMTLLMKPGLRMMVLGFRLVLTMYRSRDRCLKSYACMNSLSRDTASTLACRNTARQACSTCPCRYCKVIFEQAGWGHKQQFAM